MALSDQDSSGEEDNGDFSSSSISEDEDQDQEKIESKAIEGFISGHNNSDKKAHNSLVHSQ